MAMSAEGRSRVMRAIRSRWTRQERLFASLAPAGWERGGAGERNADFVFRGARVAVFLDGDFWHGRSVPESIPAPWREKLARTAERDARNREWLESQGWLVVSFWESEFLAAPEACVAKVLLAAGLSAPACADDQGECSSRRYSFTGEAYCSSRLDEGCLYRCPMDPVPVGRDL